jgi:hypothetical protein
MNHSPLRRSFFLIPLAFAVAWFALSPAARALCQDGCDTSNGNTFQGDDALTSNTSGFHNTANGAFALESNSSGIYNTATGYGALQNSIIADHNTAYGAHALQSNTTGVQNTATGSFALTTNTTGFANTATGASALEFNTSGSSNTATGLLALFRNTTGFRNTATGSGALVTNTIGENNTATGSSAVASNTTGNKNTAVGGNALFHNETGSRNIALGFNAGDRTSGDNNIDIGNRGIRDESNTIRIGDSANQSRTFIAAIRDVTTDNADAIAVVIDSAGQLGTVSSSVRFKSEIKPMDQTSEVILGLRPVTFHYKSDSKGTPQFGLIAEEVAEVNPDLVVRDKSGEIYTVRYEAVNAMLLNEFLKEHRTVQEQKETIAQLKHDFAHQQKQIEALTAGLQRVSAQIEMNRLAPQVVDNRQ